MIGSMRSLHLFAGVTLLFCLSRTGLAVRYEGNAGTKCALVDQMIFCYGGYPDLTALYTTNAFFGLNISQPLTANEVETNWVNLTEPSNNAVIQANVEFAMTSVPQRGILVVDGGSGYNTTDLVNQTLIYDPKNNAWSNLFAPAGTFPQMREHTMTADAQGNRLYIWGGLTTFPDASGLYAYSNTMKTLDLATRTWALLSSSPKNIPPRVFNTAVLGKDSRTIYFIGGMQIMSATNETDGTEYIYYEHASMAEIPSYNTLNDTWTLHTTTGNLVPSARYEHTTTLIDSGDIVLYGGRYVPLTADDTRPLSVASDFFYLLNTDLMTWRNESIDTTIGVGAGPLYLHSVVYPGNDSLFILWGLSTNTFSQIHILNTTQWTWTTTFGGMNPSPVSNTTEVPVSTDGDTNGGLSAGAIAGIAVGAVAGVVIIAVAGFFLLRNQKREPRNAYSSTASMSHSNLNDGFSSILYSSSHQQRDFKSKPDSSGLGYMPGKADMIAGKPDMMSGKPDMPYGKPDARSSSEQSVYIPNLHMEASKPEGM